MAFHQDRRGRDGANTDRAHGLRNRAAHARVLVDPYRLPRPEEARGRVLAHQPNTRANGKEIFGATPAGHYDRAALFLVAQHPNLLRAEQLPDLFCDHGEDLRLGRLARDERRDAPKRRLLLSQPGQPGAALGIRDGGRQELRELDQARLGVRRQGFLLPGAGGHHAPDAALNDDRRANGRANAPVAKGDIDRAGGIDIALDPRRTTGPDDERAEVVTLELPPSANGKDGRGTAPRGDEGHLAVGLAAAHVRAVDQKQPPDLLCDRREHLLRCGPAGHHRRDAPQRRLLRDQRTQILMAHATCKGNSTRLCAYSITRRGIAPRPAIRQA
jgi:hypothetical protein